MLRGEVIDICGGSSEELRLERKFTQDGLSKIPGVSDRVISYYTGRATPDYGGLKQLAQFFDVSADSCWTALMSAKQPCRTHR